MKHSTIVLGLVLLTLSPIAGYSQQEKESIIVLERQLAAVDAKVKAHEKQQKLLKDALAVLRNPEAISGEQGKRVLNSIDKVSEQLNQYLLTKRDYEHHYAEFPPEELDSDTAATRRLQELGRLRNTFRNTVSTLYNDLNSLSEALELQSKTMRRRLIGDDLHDEFIRLEETYLKDYQDPSDLIHHAIRYLSPVLENPEEADYDRLHSKVLPHLAKELPNSTQNTKEALQTLRKGIQTERDSAASELSSLKKQQAALVNKIATQQQKQFKIDQKILTWTLPVFAVGLFAILAAPGGAASA